MDKWTRIEDGYAYGERVRVWDNGAGLGPAAGSGRWAVEVDGKWLSNEDTLKDAKFRAESAVAS